MLNYCLVPEENVATSKYDSTVIQGEMRAALLDGSMNYDMERGYTRHPMIGSNSAGIIVKLGTPSIINYIKLLLWDRDMRYVSFFDYNPDASWIFSHFTFLLQIVRILYRSFG